MDTNELTLKICHPNREPNLTLFRAFVAKHGPNAKIIVRSPSSVQDALMPLICALFHVLTLDDAADLALLLIRNPSFNANAQCSYADGSTAPIVSELFKSKRFDTAKEVVMSRTDDLDVSTTVFQVGGKKTTIIRDIGKKYNDYDQFASPAALTVLSALVLHTKLANHKIMMLNDAIADRCFKFAVLLANDSPHHMPLDALTLDTINRACTTHADEIFQVLRLLAGDRTMAQYLSAVTGCDARTQLLARINA